MPYGNDKKQQGYTPGRPFNRSLMGGPTVGQGGLNARLDFACSDLGKSELCEALEVWNLVSNARNMLGYAERVWQG